MPTEKFSAFAAATNIDAADELVGLQGGVNKRFAGNLLAVRLVGTALIGGDFTGDARGTNAIDIQTARGGVAQVASGKGALAIGKGNRSAGDYAMTVGYNATASGYKSMAVGYSASVVATAQNETGYGVALGAYARVGQYAHHGVAIGFQASAVPNAAYGVAIGYKATAWLPRTVVISGLQINNKDYGEPVGKETLRYTGVEVVLLSKDVDLTAVGDQTIALPVGAHFWLDEIGVICTAFDTVTVQPIIRFGDNVGVAHQRAAAITTGLTAALKRQLFAPLDTATGLTSLSAGVTTGATATAMNGRFYWKGVLVLDQ